MSGLKVSGLEEMEPEPVDSSGLDLRCHGTGTLDCRCMGDGCCCGFHGSTECLGCPDCEWDDDGEDVFWDSFL